MHNEQDIIAVIRKLDGPFTTADVIKHLDWNWHESVSYVSRTLRNLNKRGLIEQVGKLKLNRILWSRRNQA